MLCPTCGKEIPDSAPFCAFCGARLTQPAAAPAGGPRTSGMAIASFVLGLLGFLCVTAIAAVILGIVSLVNIRRSEGALRGQGFAIAGICLAALSGLLVIPAAALYPFFMHSRAIARKSVCLNNVKNVSLALQMYLADWDDTGPPAAAWCDTLDVYVKNREVYTCPEIPGLRCAYAYNSALDRVDLYWWEDDPSVTVAIFESDRGWNATGPPEQLLPPEPRHVGGDNFGYLDGHAAWQSRGAADPYDPYGYGW